MTTSPTTQRRPSAVMDGESAMSLLSACHTGRLLRIRHDVPTVDLQVYAVHDGGVYFYAGDSSLFGRSNVGVEVVFEVDRVDDKTGAGWSVTVHGCVYPAHGEQPAAVVRSLGRGVTGVPHQMLMRLEPASVVGRRFGT